MSKTQLSFYEKKKREEAPLLFNEQTPVLSLKCANFLA